MKKQAKFWSPEWPHFRKNEDLLDEKEKKNRAVQQKPTMKTILPKEKNQTEDPAEPRRMRTRSVLF